MKIWPTWNQFKKWSLPSKISFISGVLAIITVCYQVGLYFLVPPQEPLQNKLVNGKECNVNINVKDIYGNDTVINMPADFCNDKNDDSKLNDEYVVNYYWLDQLSIGYMYSDINQLNPIFGKKSFVWKNEVYNEMKLIVQKYWNEVSYTGTIEAGVKINSQDIGLYNGMPYENFPVIKNIKNIENQYGFHKSDDEYTLNKKYSTIKSYIGYWEDYWGGVELPAEESGLNICPVKWRYLTKQDIKNNHFCVKDDKKQVNSEERSGQEILCNHFRYIDYLTRNNFPDKFLPISERSVDGCGVGLLWTFWPRRTKLLVAVIENIGTKKITIGKLKYFKESTMTLREDKKISHNEEEVNFSNQAIYPNGSFVIPMRIELQLDSGHLSEASYKNWIEGLNKENIADCKDKKVYPNSPSTLIYGKEFRPTHIEINNKMTPIREYNKLAITMVENWEKGSCPYLFVVKDGVEHKIGKILVKAKGKSNVTTEVIHLPSNIEKIVIKNLDHEIDYIDKIKISSLNYTRDTRLKKVDENYLILNTGDTFTIDLGANTNSSTLEITGFYDPLY